ncbi:hypothetical protein [Salinimicrobium sediminilitoris]|uniref:hypothetical protein n=1 Tax=Salinimicrobium sediminilitoris TaxID=2876715 RepID=UPI001E373BC8|nr:hypothetical protein [Salinimicrobium sediminilitoris]MCC8360406.1 hypothetical protein [Salinimicrobium sediminilitoris]
MNYRILFLVLMSFVLLSCDDDDYPYAEVPSVVLNEFWTQYPDGTDPEFNSIGEDYEVDFEINGNDYSALFSTSGNILKEKKEITWNKLPIEVQEALQKNYGQKKIEDPEWVRQGEDIYYQAEVKRFFLDEDIVLDAAGRLDSERKFWK